MNNLTIRLITALFAIPVFLGLVFFDSHSREVLLAILMLLGAWELGRMIAKKSGGVSTTWLSVVAVAGYLALYTQECLTRYVGLYTAGVILVYIGVAFAKVNIDKLFNWLCLNLFNPLFLGLWMGQCVVLFREEMGGHGGWLFIFVASCMWICDSFAYFTGKLIGKHKLAPHISPKKTWEGSVGGVLWTLVYAVFVGPHMTELSTISFLILAFVLSITAQVGDLLMSAAKRFTETKDSSQLIPGHGGFLDRFDSLYLSAPIAAILLPFLR